ncbi:NACHT domain-containing protein [Streptosporangium sp. G11]|uniref:NACHT domain-containing protein n=1 Tax=Streptosporangium sp. G11 TaxID=3436926 RepID=UPI003EBE57BF
MELLAAGFGVIGEMLASTGWKYASSAAQTAAVLLAALPFIAVPVLVTIGQYDLPELISTPDEVETAKRKLASLVRAQWTREAARWVGQVPIPVHWRLARSDLMDRSQFVSPNSLDISGRSDDIEQFAAKFQALKSRRLVILGEAGAGKTTLAMLLLSELLKPESPAQVPVMLSLREWDIKTYEEFHDWVSARLGEFYPHLRSKKYGLGAPRALAREFKILPVLDGLDEMRYEPRVRAMDVFKESLAADEGFILTCRTSKYEDVVKSVGPLPGAAVVEAVPLEPQEIANYLSVVATHPDHPWQRLPKELTKKKDSDFCNVLSIPLGLWLLRKVCQPERAPRQGQLDPTTLFSYSEKGIWERLFAQIIPIVLNTYPPSKDPSALFRPRHRWNPDDMRRWLEYLAYYLEEPKKNFEWWELAFYSMTRLTDFFVRLVLTLSCLLALILAIRLGFGVLAGLGTGLLGSLVSGLVAGLGGGFALWMAFASTSARWLGTPSPMEEWIRIVLGERLAGGLFVGLLFGLVGGVVFGIVGGLTAGVTFGFIFGVIVGGLSTGVHFGLVSGFSFGFIGVIVSSLIDKMKRRLPDRATTPGLTLRADRRATLLTTVVVSITFSLIFEVPTGLAFGLASMLSGALDGKNSHAWIAYTFATTRLATLGNLPRRLMPFLEDAERLELLRSIGPSYQFRHEALQTHLATSYKRRNAQ